MNEVYKTTAALVGSVVEEPIPEPPTKGAVVKVRLLRHTFCYGIRFVTA